MIYKNNKFLLLANSVEIQFKVTCILILIVTILKFTIVDFKSEYFNTLLGILSLTIGLNIFILFILSYKIFVYCAKRDGINNKYIRNLFLSIKESYLLRKYLIKIPKRIITNKSKNTIIDTNINSYNKYMNKTLVEIKTNYICVKLTIPRNHMPNKYLKELLPEIKSEVQSRYSKYFFSDIIRDNRYYYIVGKIRNEYVLHEV